MQQNSNIKKPSIRRYCQYACPGCATTRNTRVYVGRKLSGTSAGICQENRQECVRKISRSLSGKSAVLHRQRQHTNTQRRTWNKAARWRLPSGAPSQTAAKSQKGPIWRAALARASALAASRAASELACSTDALMASISSSSMLCSAACFAAFTAACFSSANFRAKALAALQSNHCCER